MRLTFERVLRWARHCDGVGKHLERGRIDHGWSVDLKGQVDAHI